MRIKKKIERTSVLLLFLTAKFVCEFITLGISGMSFQSAFTYSKLTIEALEQGVKHIKS